MTFRVLEYSPAFIKLRPGFLTNRTAFVCLLFALNLIPVSNSNADFVCSAEVSYKWAKDDISKGAKETSTTAEEAAATATKQPGASVEDGATAVHVAFIERIGADEATAKAQLQVDATRLKMRATEACQRSHENLAACVGTKLGAQGATLNGLSFSARKELERAITKDCEELKGRCTGVIVTDPVCKERVAAVTPEAAADSKEKDKKKK